MSESSETRDVGVFGMGKMGRALAEVLLTDGHRVSVWNRTASKCDELADAGAVVAKSAADAALRTEVLVLCVSDYDASMAVLDRMERNGAIEGKTVLQLSTLAPHESVDMSHRVAKRGASYLDGGILGYPPDVRERAAKIAFSGPGAVFERLESVIGSLTNHPLHVGELPGIAYVVDKIVYAQFYGIAFAYLHAAALGLAAGISISDFREITSGDERWRWKGKTMDGFLQMIEKQDYFEAGATLRAHIGAYDHVVRLSRDFGIEPGFPELVARVMTNAKTRGHEEHELAAIFEVFSGTRS